MRDIAHYIALGDSVSIDLYPALDAGETDVAVALERVPTAGAVAPIGAASLLHRNDDARWPEFTGRDILSRAPHARFTNLSQDGATIGDVFGDQLPAVEESGEETLVTLTIGGNDLLSTLAAEPSPKIFRRAVEDIASAYAHLVGELAERLPNALLLLTTVYDPSDRTGRLPGVVETRAPLPLQHLDTLNRRIREIAEATPTARVAEVYGHFLGHGASVPEEDRWYWRRSLIEPSAMGASEVRRVWIEAVEGADLEG